MLQSFALLDGRLGDRQIGTLTYDTDKKRFEMTIDNIPLADLPISLEARVWKGNRTIDHSETMTWIRERICPPGRHNISEILRDNGLSEYDEYGLLMLTKAKCDKDELYLAPLA